MTADQSSRTMIATDGLDRTLFVEAGAGTGKTTMLVERISKLVISKGVSLRNVAAITFTEAAAAELQARIRVTFERMLADPTLSDTTRQRCRQALADSDMAAVSTLHGFANRLLAQFGVDIGLPPRIRVLDEVASTVAEEDRWDRFVDRLYDDPANEELLIRAAAIGAVLEARYSGQSTLRDVASVFNDNWDRLAEVVANRPGPLLPVDFSPFDRAVDAIEKLPGDCTDPDDKFYRRLTDELIPAMRAVRGIAEPERKLRILMKREAFKKGSGGTKGAWGGEVAGAKGHVDAVNEAVAEVRQSVTDGVIDQLRFVIAGMVLEAAESRRSDGGLEYHDLLVLARELVRHNADARAALHAQYTHLLLDEFQDTDPIQIELAVLIAASLTGDEPSLRWDEMDVDDGRLFFVGDPKQSIYRFRRADIDLFLGARDRFGDRHGTQSLTANFRTVRPILDWLNALFGQAMPVEIASMQPRYEPLEAFRDADSGHDHRPVLLGGPHPDPKVKADVLRRAEADDVAATVADIRDRPDAWPVRRKDVASTGTGPEGWRPASLSDVTILVPTRTSLPFLRESLEALGLPYRLATGTLVYDAQEVRDTLAALRAIDDPTDTLSLVAALRSPLYGCSDVDLFRFRNAGGQWDLRREPPEILASDDPVRSALAHLRQLWEARWWSSPAGMVERLLRERHAFLLAFGDPRPAEVWRRLRFLVDQARAFEEGGGGTLRAFTDWASLQGADGARVHEPLLPETDDDAVRIMTIHGSKGLEFPITILSGMTIRAGGNRGGVSVLWGESGPPEVKLTSKVATANHQPRADLENEMDVHEKLRLLYVAATRAEDHLVISCHHQAGGAPDATYATRVWSFSQDSTELLRPFQPDSGDRLAAWEAAGRSAGTSRPEGVAAPVDALEVRERWLAERRVVIARQGRRRVVSATAIAREANLEPGGSLLPGDLEPGDDEVAEAQDESIVRSRRRGRVGSAIGTAVHATLEVVDLADPADVDAQVRRQCAIESIPEHVDVVAAMVRSALRSDAVRLAAASRHHKELFVSAAMGDRVVEGYVDLLIEADGGLIVVDYKTDSVTEATVDDKVAFYELQAAAYAVALQVVTGMAVSECRFVFCRPGGPIERTVVDLPAAMEKVERRLEARQFPIA